MKLTDDEIQYHAKMVQLVEASKKLEQDIAQAQQSLMAMRGAIEHWTKHLGEKYQLTDNDFVSANGEVKKA
jgi:hypothetical protein